jgi:hypothetical protein
VRAVEAMALGESNLSFGELNRGPKQLTNFIVSEYAPLRP